MDDSKAAATVPAWAPVALAVLGAVGPLVTPAAVGGFTEAGYSEAQAGALVSIEFAATFLGTFVAVALHRRVSWRAIAFGGLLLAAGADLAGLGLSSFNAFAAGRFAVGLGLGLAFAVGYGLAAKTARPHLTFAAIVVAQQVVSAALVLVIPPLVAGGGKTPLLLILAGLNLLGLIAALRLAGVGAETTAAPVSFRTQAPGMAALLLYFAAFGGAWAYIERFGAHAGASPLSAGVSLAAATLCGALGGLAAGWTPPRWGLKAPMALGAAAGVLSIVAPALLVSQPVVLGSAAGIQFVWAFLTPFLYTAITRRSGDESLALAGSMQLAGVAAGPALASLLVAAGGLAWGALGAGAVCVLATLVVWPTLKAPAQ
jgi:predicted MFS family arabinose efflux permease